MNLLPRPFRTLIFLLCAMVALSGGVVAQPDPRPQGAPSQPNPASNQAAQTDTQTPGDNSLAEAMSLHTQVYTLVNQGKYDAAMPLAERALAIRLKKLGPNHLLVAASMSQLASVCRMKGDFARAKSLLENALAIREGLQGPKTALVAATLNNLAVLYRDEGNYARAIDMLVRALSIFEDISGVESADAALAHNNLSAFYLDKGDFQQAEDHAAKALSIRHRVFGTEHVQVAWSLNALALVYQTRGDYVRAEALLQEALKMREKLEGEQHPDVAASLSNLASLYEVKGDYERAEALYLRASDIFKQVHSGVDNLEVATVLGNLAAMWTGRGDYARAEKNLLQALALREKLLGAEHPDVAHAQNNLGALYRDMGDLARAQERFQQAEKIYARAVGYDHPDYAMILNNLASVAQAEGEYARAEELFQRALSVREQVLGQEHPDVAVALSNLATLYWEMGDAARAVSFLTRVGDVREHNLALILTTGSETQKRLYLQTLTNETYTTISLHTLAGRDDQQAARLALTTILRRKGRALDAMTDQISVLRQRANEEDRALLDRLADARAQLAALVIKGQGLIAPTQYLALVARLRAEIEELEAQVSARSAAFRLLVRESPVTVEQVRAALPADTVLIELALYRPYALKAKAAAQRFGAARYVAYVLGRAGELRSVELGDAAVIEAAVKRFREALNRPSSPDVRQTGRELDELVMRPVRRLLGATRTLLISPDGPLNLVPFAAMVDEQGRYLIETYTITYLTSGRDLLRLQAQTGRRPGPAVVFANPTFDQAITTAGQPPPAAGSKRGIRAVNFAQLRWPALKGTAEEAAALKALLPGARVLTERDATEAALKQVSAPRILHVATHGFFLPEQSADVGTVANTRRGLSFDSRAAVSRSDNVLLRSGLVLAGANKLQSGGGEDGVFTALEAAGLDLWGTQLVVLSACETGVGSVSNGEGVYGLRRALVLAGAESQVMSLWKVDDAATRDLMVAYYKRLQAGEWRAIALRQVQLEMLKGGQLSQTRQGRELLPQYKREGVRRNHPYFWASFIQSGGWRGLGDVKPP